MKTTPGQVILLDWEEYVPEFLYVRGHVAEDSALDAVRSAYGDDYKTGRPVYAWAQWSVGCGPDGPCQVLVDHDQPGRGRFEVTRIPVAARVVNPQSWRERRYGVGSWPPWVKPGEECDCSAWRPADCGCGGSCACHWEPRAKGPWWRSERAAGDPQRA